MTALSSTVYPSASPGNGVTDKTVTITVYSTSIEVPSDEWGYLPNNYISIKKVAGKFVEFEFRPGQRPILKQKFTLFDKRRNIRIMPRHALPLIESYLQEQNVQYKIVYGQIVIPRNVEIPINPNWQVRDYQEPAIEFLVNKKNSMRVLSLQTGQGKSFSAVKASSELGYCTMVLVSGLVEQWEEVFRTATLLKQEDVYVIKGTKSLIYLFSNPEYKPTVFIGSSETMKPYVVGQHEPTFPSWHEFCHWYGIGTKIMDECHLRFLSNTEIDLNTTIENNLYLSATPSRSSSRERQIFGLIFPDEITYGKGNYNRYVNTFFYKYRLDLNIRERRVLTRKGYSHSRYESYLLSNKAKYAEWIQTVIYPLMNQHYINIRKPGQKCLIFVATIVLADKMVESLQKLYPDLAIHTYLGRDSEKVLQEVDIIVSTHKSAGTGSDIKDLRSVCNTVSYQSPITVKQQIGRLRELPNDLTPIMFDMSNDYFSAHKRHAEERCSVYREVSKNLSIKEI